MPPIGPISDEMFDRYMQHWQNWQRLVSLTYQSDQIGSPQPVRLAALTGLSGQPVSNQREVSLLEMCLSMTFSP